jgi:putative addiction module component (TIGR02574 family)
MSEKGNPGMSFEELKREALKLSYEDREILYYTLHQSLEGEEEGMDPDHARLWRKEIERRYREYKEGKAQVFDAEEVVAELRAKFA